MRQEAASCLEGAVGDNALQSSPTPAAQQLAREGGTSGEKQEENLAPKH